jgi:hypothetical protein
MVAEGGRARKLLAETGDNREDTTARSLPLRATVFAIWPPNRTRLRAPIAMIATRSAWPRQSPRYGANRGPKMTWIL